MEGVLSKTILKVDHSRNIPYKFGLIWFSSYSFRGEDINVKVYDVRRTEGELRKT
jgi:hypothetical protein